MIYSSEAIKKAYAEIEARRNLALENQNMHIEEIKNNLPEAYSVYLEINQAKDMLSEAIISKNTDIAKIILEIKQKNIACQEKLKKILTSCGYSSDYLLANYTCKLCNDTGAINGMRCQCVTELLNKYTVEKLNEQCKIKLQSFSDFMLDYYPESVEYKDSKSVNSREIMCGNLKYLMDYAQNFTKNSHGLFMVGKTGLGKTFLSSCIANELLKKGFSVAFDSIQNYLRDIEKEHFGKADGDTLETLLNADLVILDDLGSEFSSSFNNSVIYNIINSRSNAGMPTIVSTNLSLDELKARYDDRITSRLMGSLHPIRFIGEDIRQKKRRNGIF